jgi:predicted Zn-dependent protease
MRTTTLLSLSLALPLALAPPAQAQFTAFMSQDQERKIGAEEHPKALKQFGGVYSENKLDEYVLQIGLTLAPNVSKPQPEWIFTLLDAPMVNAFALPGGYVYVTRGIMALANNEAELAGVIGHEMGHVEARHSAQRYSQGMATQLGATALGVLGAIFLGTDAVGGLAAAGGQLFLQRNSREHENEADELGLATMARTGYSPQAVPAFLQSLNDETALTMKLLGRPGGELEFNMMQTHPRTVDRVQKTIDEVRALPANATFRRDAYLDRIDGMLFGDSEEQGYIRGRTFAHTKLGIGFTAPPRFYLMNDAAAVTGTRPDGVRMIFDNAPPQNARMSPADYLTRVWAGQARLADMQTFTVNGLPAATGQATVNAQGGQMVARLAAIAAGDTMYRFLFVMPPNIARQAEPDLIRAVHSFHRLTREEAAALKPLRIRIAPVKSGDTVESFAARMAMEEYKADWFRVINGLRNGEKLEPGQRVKLVQ